MIGPSNCGCLSDVISDIMSYVIQTLIYCFCFSVKYFVFIFFGIKRKKLIFKSLKLIRFHEPQALLYFTFKVGLSCLVFYFTCV